MRPFFYSLSTLLQNTIDKHCIYYISNIDTIIFLIIIYVYQLILSKYLQKVTTTYPFYIHKSISLIALQE